MNFIAPELLARLAELPEGWATAPQLASDLAAEDQMGRTEIYAALRSLVNAGIWEGIAARHNGRTQYVYRVDAKAVRELMA